MKAKGSLRLADWASIVPIVKPNGSIRICENYKLTVNQASRVESYPLPHIENIFAPLSGGKLFTKLDLAHAYNQIPLDKKSKKLVVINTQKGLYKECSKEFHMHLSIS